MWATVTARKMAKDVVLGVRCPSHGVKFDILIVICSLDTTNTQEGMHQACLSIHDHQRSAKYTVYSGFAFTNCSARNPILPPL